MTSKLGLFPFHLAVAKLYRRPLSVAVSAPHYTFSQFLQNKFPASITPYKQRYSHLTASLWLQVVCPQYGRLWHSFLTQLSDVCFTYG